VLLGTSGSGKSTVLRLIAGLIAPDSGTVVLHGRDVTKLPPQKRGTGFVFQNYSIFRHMSVAENVEFGLKIRRIPPQERARKREQLLDLVGLAGFDNRYAGQLSGGQLQRVALARALAYEPNVLLLDEPFGALDSKIRTQLRRSLKEIQRRLKVTTILVTHDQEEAFELADRIGIIERGRLLETGPPENLYAAPKTLFVATFLGAGTVLAGKADSGSARFGSLSLPIPPETAHEQGARAQVLFRPEQVVLSPDMPDGGTPLLGRGRVVERTFSGPFQRVRLQLPHLEDTRQVAPHVPFGEEGLLVDALVPSEMRFQSETVWVELRSWHILDQPRQRLLVYAGYLETVDSCLDTAKELSEQLDASSVLLGVAEDQASVESLGILLQQQKTAHGLDAAELQVYAGDPAEHLARLQQDGNFDLRRQLKHNPDQDARVLHRPDAGGAPKAERSEAHADLHRSRRAWENRCPCRRETCPSVEVRCHAAPCDSTRFRRAQPNNEGTSRARRLDIERTGHRRIRSDPRGRLGNRRHSGRSERRRSRFDSRRSPQPAVALNLPCRGYNVQGPGRGTITGAGRAD